MTKLIMSRRTLRGCFNLINGSVKLFWKIGAEMLSALIRYRGKHCACRHWLRVSALSSEDIFGFVVSPSTLRQRNLKTQLYFGFGVDGKQFENAALFRFWGGRKTG